MPQNRFWERQFESCRKSNGFLHFSIKILNIQFLGEKFGQNFCNQLLLCRISSGFVGVCAKLSQDGDAMFWQVVEKTVDSVHNFALKVQK